jgi:ABC-2 family transporter
MTGLIDVIRLDHRIMRARYPMLLVLLAIGVTVGILTGSPLTGTLLVTLISAPIGGSYFAIYETSRLDHLFGTLPVRRGVVEAAIYLYSMVVIGANGALAALLGWQLGRLDHLPATGTQIAVTYTLSLLAVCVYIGLLYPVYLGVPFSKVYILSNVPFYVIAVAFVFVTKRTHWLDNLHGVVDFIHNQPGWTVLICIVGGLTVLATSWTIAHGTTSVIRRR